MYLNTLCLRETKNRHPASMYLFKVNIRNTRKRCDICSKLTIKPPERRYYFWTGKWLMETLLSNARLLWSHFETMYYFPWKINFFHMKNTESTNLLRHENWKDIFLKLYAVWLQVKLSILWHITTFHVILTFRKTRWCNFTGTINYVYVETFKINI